MICFGGSVNDEVNTETFTVCYQRLLTLPPKTENYCSASSPPLTPPKGRGTQPVRQFDSRAKSDILSLSLNGSNRCHGAPDTALSFSPSFCPRKFQCVL